MDGVYCSKLGQIYFVFYMMPQLFVYTAGTCHSKLYLMQYWASEVARWLELDLIESNLMILLTSSEIF